MSYGFKKIFFYLPFFLAYVIKKFPSARIVVAVIFLGLILEYAALSVMVPLASVSGKSGGMSLAIENFWNYIASTLGLPANANTWLWLFLLLLGLRIAVSFLQTVLNTWVSKLIHVHLSGDLFSYVVKDEKMAEIYKKSVGHYIALAGDESFRVGQVFFNLAQATASIIAALVGLAVMFFFSILAFKITLLFLLISAILIGFALKRIFLWIEASAKLSREAATIFLDSFNGIRSIRTMAGENFVVDQYQRAMKIYGCILFKLDALNQAVRSLPALLLVVAGLIVLHPSAKFFDNFSAIYFFAVTTMLIRVLGFLGIAVSSGGRAAIDIRGAFDIEDIIRPASKNINLADKKNLNSIQHINISDLCFSYAMKNSVLSGINAKLMAGHSYALIGKSGSGKSTLSDLLLGLMEPTSGKLEIENFSYEDINLFSLRQKVVLVEQQARIFSGTISENISFGLNCSNDQLNNAIEVSGLVEFINSLENGIDEVLNYQGANLSGGQRQRIGLARAILRCPDVLILDEATSALDTETRDLVMSNLKQMFNRKILIYITHDQHIIKSVDEVWYMHKGNLKIKKNVYSN